MIPFCVLVPQHLQFYSFSSLFLWRIPTSYPVIISRSETAGKFLFRPVCTFVRLEMADFNFRASIVSFPFPSFWGCSFSTKDMPVCSPKTSTAGTNPDSASWSFVPVTVGCGEICSDMVGFAARVLWKIHLNNELHPYPIPKSFRISRPNRSFLIQASCRMPFLLLTP